MRRRSKPAIANSGVPLQHHASLEAATRWCLEAAQMPTAMLLSPACASLDMFRNYAHRAEVFIATVQAMADERGPLAGGSTPLKPAPAVAQEEDARRLCPCATGSPPRPAGPTQLQALTPPGLGRHRADGLGLLMVYSASIALPDSPKLRAKYRPPTS